MYSVEEISLYINISDFSIHYTSKFCDEKQTFEYIVVTYHPIITP